MKLDINCIREILLYLESLPYGQTTTPDKMASLDSFHYSKNEIQYNSLKLYEGEYIIVLQVNFIDSAMPIMAEITDITFAGHQFLESIRNDEIFSKAKQISSKVGNMSLSIIQSIANGFASAIAQKFF